MRKLISKIPEGGWNIAVRPSPTSTILADQQTPFHIIPNAWRSWAADPFIFEHNGTVYIFAELFDYLKRRGSIGYTCLKDGNWQNWTVVIDEPFHMSYPNIFVWNNEIYMLPETSADRTLRLYKAVSFPHKWELDRIIATDVAYVDTTFFTHQGKLCALTTDVSDPQLHKDLFLTFGEDLSLLNRETICESQTALSRCGGNFFYRGTDWIRVSQDCMNHYGNALVFSYFTPESLVSCGINAPILHLHPQSLSVDRKHAWTGLHTYNSTSNYEVVDIERNHYNPLGLFGRVLYKLKLIK